MLFFRVRPSLFRPFRRRPNRVPSLPAPPCLYFFQQKTITSSILFFTTRQNSSRSSSFPVVTPSFFAVSRPKTYTNPCRKCPFSRPAVKTHRFRRTSSPPPPPRSISVFRSRARGHRYHQHRAIGDRSNGHHSIEPTAATGHHGTAATGGRDPARPGHASRGRHRQVRDRA